MSGPFGSSQWMYNPSSSFYPYAIDQSLRFEDGDSPYLSRTPSGAGNRKTWTWSAWVKRANITSEQTLFGAHKGANDYVAIQFDANDTLNVTYKNVGASGGSLSSQTRRKITTQVFRDVSSFYHLVVKFDAANTNCDIYVNGTEVTSFSVNEEPQNLDFEVNSTELHTVGTFQTAVTGVAVTYFDGYMSEVNLIDGSALGPDSFGETKDGIWVPKNVSGLTYGTNGFHLDFADDSAIGNDVSGEDNDYTVSGGGSPTLVAADVTEDTPTNNHSTWNPLATKLNAIFSEGNTAVNLDDNQGGTSDMISTMVCPLGVDIYGEFKATAFYGGALASGIAIGLIEEDFIRTEGSTTIRQISGGVFYQGNGYLYTDNVISETQEATYTLNDIIGIKVNRTTDEVKFYKNNTLEWTQSIDATKQYHFGVINFYTNSTRGIAYQGYFAASSWTYTPEANFLALCSASLPEPAIISGEDYFNTVLWTGDDADDRSISGVGFQPDWTWIKQRSAPDRSHCLVDSVRGATKRIKSDINDLEDTFADGVQAFESDGFQIGTNNTVNASPETYVAWNWLAGTAVSGATTGSGTAKTYTGSVNTKSGFSIIKYVGNGTSGHTIPHNLTVDGVATTPTMIIVKRLDDGGGWRVQHKDLAATHYVALDTNAAKADLATIFNDTAFNSTVFTVGSAVSINSDDADSSYIAYCFTDIEGFSKAGMYVGNSSADGTYVHTGFKVSWLMVKDRDSTGSWYIWDDKRSTHNEMNDRLVADLPAEEVADREVDFLSNGFKLRESNNAHNTSGREYIYLAFAEQPFKYANAR